MTDDKIYAVEEPELCGRLPVRAEIVVLKADEPRQLKLGWVFTEKIGKAYITKSASNILHGHKLVRSVLVE